jgi:RNA polymerase sigma factor (sigma-70 family)
MISRIEYEGLRERFRRDGEIDERLYRLLLGLVRAVVFGGRLPPAYSPTGSWNAESAQDAAHGWITRRLLQTNSLLAAFDLALEPRPFLRSLEQNFRHYLENERERGEIDNLISRSGGLMASDERFRDWIPQARASDTWWGLAEWQEPQAYQGSDRLLIAQAWAVGEVTIFRYSHSVGRASPVLSTEELGRFLASFLERVQELLTLAHLAVVYRARFDLDPPRHVELESTHLEEIPAEHEVGEEEVSAAAIAVLAELTERQFDVLVRYADGRTLDQIAEELEISRGTVDNELKRAGPAIDRQCIGGLGREQILEKVLEARS